LPWKKIPVRTGSCKKFRAGHVRTGFFLARTGSGKIVYRALALREISQQTTACFITHQNAACQKEDRAAPQMGRHHTFPGVHGAFVGFYAG
jgi:hypothetical protein